MMHEEMKTQDLEYMSQLIVLKQSEYWLKFMYSVQHMEHPVSLEMSYNVNHHAFLSLYLQIYG